MSEEIRVIRSEVRVRGADNIELRHGAPLGVLLLVWWSYAASVGAFVYAAAAGVRWPIAFALFMAMVAAEIRAQAWRSAARRLSIGLLAATDESLRLKPQPKKRGGKR